MRMRLTTFARNADQCASPPVSTIRPWWRASLPSPSISRNACIREQPATPPRNGFDFARIPLFPPSTHGKPAGPEDESIKGDDGPDVAPSTGTPEPVPLKGGGTQALTISNVRGPKAANCGSYEWVIQWVLAQKSTAGGHAVQHLTAAYDIKDAAGKDVTVATMGQAKWDYWEAWPFNANQKVTTFAEGGDIEDDGYSDKDMGSTKGRIVVTGDAQFFEGLNPLPTVFKKNNPATQAGILASSTTDPKLTGGTASVAHNLTVEWDCAATSSPTKIASHSP